MYVCMLVYVRKYGVYVRMYACTLGSVCMLCCVCSLCHVCMNGILRVYVMCVYTRYVCIYI